MKKSIHIFKTLWQKYKKIPNSIAILVILGYRALLSPSVGVLRYMLNLKPSCIFYPTCSEYGIACYKKYNFFTATKKTLHRVSRCHPRNIPRIDLP